MLERESLKGTILPLVSVDEYLPKAGSQEEIIVVAFYTIDEDPANDLDDFIEKGVIDVLDVDVSPNPDENGNYLVFVEIERKPTFFEKFYSLLKDVENVSGKQEWKVKAYLADDVVAYDDDSLLDYIVTLPDEYEVSVTENIRDLFKNSNVLTCDVQDCIIKLASSRQAVVLEYIGKGDSVLKEHKIYDQPIELERIDSRVIVLRTILGSSWDVNKLREHMVLQHIDGEPILVKLLE